MFNVRKMPSEEGKRATVECKVVTLLVQELFEMLPKRGQKAAKRGKLNNFCNFRVMKMCSIGDLFIHAWRPYFFGERKIISLRTHTYLLRRTRSEGDGRNRITHQRRDIEKTAPSQTSARHWRKTWY